MTDAAFRRDTDLPLLKEGADLHIVLRAPRELGVAENSIVSCPGRIVRVETGCGRYGLALQVAGTVHAVPGL